MDASELFMATATSLFQTADPTKPKHPSDTTFPTVVPDPPIFEHATAAGYRTLWVVFVLMLLASVTFIALGWTLPASKRLYHHVTATIAIISTLTYFALATRSGVTWHHTVIRESHDTVPDTFKHIIRQVSWARYVDWLLTIPLVLIDLSIVSGLNGASIFTAVTAGVITVLSGLFSAFAHGKGQKWGWYTIAIIAYLVVIYQLLFRGRKFANARGNSVSKFYSSIAAYTVVVWAAYPVIWAIAGGRHILSVNGEIIAYAVLDILAKGVFGGWLLITHRRVPETNVDVDGFWVHGFATEGRIRVGDEEGA